MFDGKRTETLPLSEVYTPLHEQEDLRIFESRDTRDILELLLFTIQRECLSVDGNKGPCSL
jgi:hypothetical protein